MAKHHHDKTLILVHGRSWKPGKADLELIWTDALRAGISRDRPDQMESFERMRVSFVYYGDLSNSLLEAKQVKPSLVGVEARRRVLNELRRVPADGFTKAAYQRVPGQESLKQRMADCLAPVLGLFHLTDNLVEQVAPDMRDYWNQDSAYGSACRGRMTPLLRDAFDRGDSICVIGHSLGSMIGYDSLWKFSRSYDFEPYHAKKVDLLISAGSPLADETVKRKLKGANCCGERRYPGNVKRWLNLAAEDDYICHDSRVAGDFRRMRHMGLIDQITDRRIFNLSCPEGRSNPHHSTGYLIHPEMAQAVAEWLSSDP